MAVNNLNKYALELMQQNGIEDGYLPSILGLMCHLADEGRTTPYAETDLGKLLALNDGRIEQMVDEADRSLAPADAKDYVETLWQMGLDWSPALECLAKHSGIPREAFMN